MFQLTRDTCALFVEEGKYRPMRHGWGDGAKMEELGQPVMSKEAERLGLVFLLHLWAVAGVWHKSTCPGAFWLSNKGIDPDSLLTPGGK